MFYYINLNKNLIDIRLSNSIDSNNFHSQMENLGRINQVLILCWELNIRFIKIANIIGEIKFGFTYTNYNIYNYYNLSNPKSNHNLNPLESENYIELSNGLIYLIYNAHIINFDNGFLSWKQRTIPNEKAKIKSDIITGNGHIYKKEKLQEILGQLSSGKNNFVVLASESEKYPNSYKLLVPDVNNKNEVKYINIIEQRTVPIIIKQKTMRTRTYCLIIYTFDCTTNDYIPSYSIYLSGSNNLTPNIKLADTEFESILYNCLPTPKYSQQEIDSMNNYYELSDSKYNNLKSRAIAIDPPGSKDKDDAVSFNIISYDNNPKLLEMFVHIADIPSIINLNSKSNSNTYHFYYGLHKMETDYLHGVRYPMIDTKLSENLLSLCGPNKRAFTIKITYRFRPDLQSVFDVPDKVEMYLEKNIKIFATTYESIAKGTTDYSKDLPVNNQYIIKHKLQYNGKNIPTLNPIPCESKTPIVNNIQWENYKDINNQDRIYLKTQLEQLTKIYGILLRSLNIAQEIKPIMQTKQYVNNDFQYNLREEWVHRLIELTAIEANKYSALILYTKIKEKTFGIGPSNYIGKLNTLQIKAANEYFSKQERFYLSETSPTSTTNLNDEGIFRGLYYGAKGYNETPEYVNLTYKSCLPSVIIPDISHNQTHNQTQINVLDLNNLYLKYQMDKIKLNSNQIPSPLVKLLGLASFNQTNENLGIALYSTTIRPHFNTRCYYYTYFTSPMRRIVDCFVQNCLISDESLCSKYIELFKTKLLNRTDINTQCEKYNLYISVCNKIFGSNDSTNNYDNKNGEFICHYIKYGDEQYNNLYLPNLDITITVSNNLNGILKPEGKIKLKFKQITEPLDVEIVEDQLNQTNNSITVNDIIEEQIQLYFQKEIYPNISTHNYNYLNWKLLC